MRKNLVLLSTIFLVSSCSQGLHSSFTDENLNKSTNNNELSSQPSGSESTPVPTPSTPENPQPTQPVVTDPVAGLCGILDFNGINWPNELSTNDKKGLELALSISGSYEGQQNWQNITNNFDGQGMSLGLLQQNFGQGSLQPLLFKMRTDYNTEFKTYFVDSDFKSLDQMLLNWKGIAVQSLETDLNTKLSFNSFSEEELFPQKNSISNLDIPEKISEISDKIEMFSSSSNSVSWAVKNIYSDQGKTFIPRWKKSFQTLAISATYRGIQVQSSLPLLRKAQGYFQYFGFHEIRSLLLMYDFVVQNGGFNQTHKDQYMSFIKSKPNATETQKAQKLLSIRLTSVRPEYVNDVRSRKSTIINGTGTVHGKVRNLAKEYCFNPNEIL